MATSTASVTFTATDTATATFSPALTSNPARIIGHGVVITDGGGPVVATVSGVTNTGCTVSASGVFSGIVYILGSD